MTTPFPYALFGLSGCLSHGLFYLRLHEMRQRLIESLALISEPPLVYDERWAVQDDPQDPGPEPPKVRHMRQERNTPNAVSVGLQNLAEKAFTL